MPLLSECSLHASPVPPEPGLHLSLQASPNAHLSEDAPHSSLDQTLPHSPGTWRNCVRGPGNSVLGLGTCRTPRHLPEPGEHCELRDHSWHGSVGVHRFHMIATRSLGAPKWPHGSLCTSAGLRPNPPLPDLGEGWSKTGASSEGRVCPSPTSSSPTQGKNVPELGRNWL